MQNGACGTFQTCTQTLSSLCNGNIQCRDRAQFPGQISGNFDHPAIVEMAW